MDNAANRIVAGLKAFKAFMCAKQGFYRRSLPEAITRNRKVKTEARGQGLNREVNLISIHEASLIGRGEHVVRVG